MTGDAKKRLLILKKYLDNWNWEVAPLFMMVEEDADALRELLDMYEGTIERRKAKYQRYKDEHNNQ